MNWKPGEEDREAGKKDKKSFVRRGSVGDWRRHFGRGDDGLDAGDWLRWVQGEKERRGIRHDFMLE